MMKLRSLLSVLAGVATVVGLLQGCAPVVVAGAVGGGAIVFEDRRTTGAQAEDKSILVKAESAINQQFGDRVHVNSTPYNRRVLLTGEAPDAATKAAVARAVAQIENVTAVINEIRVGGNASLTSRTNDSVITSKVKGNMIDARDVNAIRYKVTTEAGVVYLQGLVTRAEGDRGAEVAARTSGVSRVVKVFEYIQPPPDSAEAKAAAAARAQPANATGIGSGAGVPITSPDYK